MFRPLCRARAFGRRVPRHLRSAARRSRTGFRRAKRPHMRRVAQGAPHARSRCRARAGARRHARRRARRCSRVDVSQPSSISRTTSPPKDLALAVREGFRSVEHVKRYTTAGMATDQGKTSNMNALGVLSQVTRRPIPEIGLTTFRLPYTPVTFGTLAGPARRRSVRAGAAHADPRMGGTARRRLRGCRPWKRARYFPRAGETMHAAVRRECRQSRTGRPLRCLDARQDRGRRPRRGRIPQPHVCQFLDQPRAGRLPLRRHAARGRLRHGRRRRRAPGAGPVSRDDHDRRRRRACCT